LGASASQDKIEWQGQVQTFWRINIELIYRPSTHNVFLPNVGWNVIVNGKKQRAWTYITEKGQVFKVPSPHPVSLNATGGFLCGPRQDNAGYWNGSSADGDDDTLTTGAIDGLSIRFRVQPQTRYLQIQSLARMTLKAHARQGNWSTESTQSLTLLTCSATHLKT
jgi:hypothetical protein